MHSDPYQQLFEGRREKPSRPVGGGWLSRRPGRARVLLAIGIMVPIGILVSIASWQAHLNSPVHKYEQMKTGMTYEEVASIMGGPGREVARGPVDLAPEYEWRTWILDMTYIYIAFGDGRVTAQAILHA